MKEMYKQYVKKTVTMMRPVAEHEAQLGFDPADNISVSSEDKAKGSPKLGDMVALNVDNHADKWLVSEDYFEANFIAK